MTHPEQYIALGYPVGISNTTTVEQVLAIPAAEAESIVDAVLHERDKQNCGAHLFVLKLLQASIHFDLDRLFEVLVFYFDAAPKSCDMEYGLQCFYTSMFTEAIVLRSKKIVSTFFLNMNPQQEQQQQQQEQQQERTKYQNYFFGDGKHEEGKILWQS